MQFIKRLIRRLTPFRGNASAIPSTDTKRARLRQIAQEFPVSTFVETGTFLGDTLEYLRTDFKELISIELSPELAARARKRYADNMSIKILAGDSSIVLKSVLERLDGPAFFWLDGHYSHSCTIGDSEIETALGAQETPILKELELILGRGCDRDVIVIDDARLFNGDNGYPTLHEIQAHIRLHGWRGTFANQCDMLTLTPGE
jgi:hypothetical protein